MEISVALLGGCEEDFLEVTHGADKAGLAEQPAIQGVYHFA